MEKGWIQNIHNPCVVFVLLMPKKDGKWRSSYKDIESQVNRPSYRKNLQKTKDIESQVQELL